MNTNLVKLDKELALSQQDNTVTEITKQVGNVMGALQKFEEETEAKAIKNAENLEVDAIGVDLLPEAGKEFMYTEFNRIGEELAEAENRKDRKAVRELKLEGANLIKAQNTIGQMLKDHAEDLLGVDGEGSYSGGSDKTMMNMLINKEYTIRKDGKDMVIDFTGPNGKKGIKLEDLDEHIYLKKNDLAVNYDKGIMDIRQAARKGEPFEKDAFAVIVKQTLNTTQKLVASMWDNNFTLKDGKTLKDLWQEENPNLDANQYLRTSGGNWDENAVREFANEKLMQGGINDAKNYAKKEKTDGDGKGSFAVPGNQFGDAGYISYRSDSYIRRQAANIDRGKQIINFGNENYVFDKESQKYTVESPGVDNGVVLTKQQIADRMGVDLSLIKSKDVNIDPNTVDEDTGITYKIMANNQTTAADEWNKVLIPRNNVKNKYGLQFEKSGGMFSSSIRIIDRNDSPVTLENIQEMIEGKETLSFDRKGQAAEFKTGGKYGEQVDAFTKIIKLLGSEGLDILDNDGL
jgi:hypothetical protein